MPDNTNTKNISIMKKYINTLRKNAEAMNVSLNDDIVRSIKTNVRWRINNPEINVPTCIVYINMRANGWTTRNLYN